MRQVFIIPELFARFGLPHSDPALINRGDQPFNMAHWTRRDGTQNLLCHAGHEGLPWGKWPRMILMLLASEARSANVADISLPGITAVLGMLNCKATGGSTGSIGAFKVAWNRLLATRFTLTADTTKGNGEGPSRGRMFRIAERHVGWDGAAGMRITLSHDFLELCLGDAIELDRETVTCLQRNVSALEAYIFLNHLAASRPGATSFPTSALAQQLGYACPTHEAKARLTEAIRRVRENWPEIGMDAGTGSVVFQVDRPHVAELERAGVMESLQMATVGDFPLSGFT